MPTKKTKKPKHVATLREELGTDHFRVSIFGSARIKKNDAIYKKVFKLAKEIAQYEIDIVTGGGPGLMEAANAGHAAGDIENRSDSIGFTIQLPFEKKDNEYVEIRKHFQKFSNRLDHFVAISDVVIVMPGGIGTCLELFYTWQLTQVKHICPIPVILIGNMWKELFKWIKKHPIKDGLISKKDLENIHIAKDNDEAMNLILKAFDTYKKVGKEKFCKNIKKYKLK